MNDLEIASESAQATPASPSALQLAAVGGAVLLLVVHFGFTFLHVSPVNPAKVQFERWVTAWTQPVFEQNWKLFAPDPIAVDQGVLVRYQDSAGVGEFRDITTPYLLEKHHNLLPTRSGYQLSGVVTRFLEAREAIVQTEAASAPTGLFLSKKQLRDAQPLDVYSYRQALADLQTTAVAHLSALSAVRFQLRLVQHVFPRYSQRLEDGPGPISHSTSPWFTVADIPSPAERSTS